MRARRLATPGAYELRPAPARDARGCFVKPFSAAEFTLQGLEREWGECFWSRSRRGVVRGLHYQAPPDDHAKLVWCPHGALFDVLLDLRRGSPRFGRAESLRLSAEAGNAVYVPRGVAHGFQALSAGAVTCYLVSSAHSPARDGGVRWDSARVRWPLPARVVSARDRALPSWDETRTPFVFHGR